MTLKLTIEMDNAAFHWSASKEAARILHDAARQITGANFADAYDRDLRLLDVNGNVVGQLEVTI